MERLTNQQTDEWTGPTNEPTNASTKKGLWWLINALKTFKNISNVFKLSNTPFWQLCDGQTEGLNNLRTYQKVT